MKRPVFYNSLLSNCTTLIWLQNKLVNPGHIPFSWKILLSGYVPEYLYEIGWLDQQLPFAELKSRAYVNRLIKGHEISSLFSSIIRSQTGENYSVNNALRYVATKIESELLENTLMCRYEWKSPVL